MKNGKITLWALILFVLLRYNYFAQSAGDYSSTQSGNWNVAGTWSYYNGSNWMSATTPPDSNDGVVTIQSTHTVTVTDNQSARDVVINSGCTLTLDNGSALTVANGTGDDLTVIGTLNLSGGTLALKNNVAISGSGSFNINGGTLTAGDGVVLGGTVPYTFSSGYFQCNGTGSGTSVAAGSVLTFSGGTLQGSGNLTINGSMTWSGGTITAKSTTIASGATLDISGSEVKTFRLGEGKIYNSGTINWTGTGNIQGASMGFENNSGALFDIKEDASIVYDGGGGYGFTFVNNGTLRKSAGNGTFAFDYLNLTNSGTVECQSGILSLNYGGTHTGSFSVSDGALLKFSGYSTTHYVGNDATFTGAGTVELAGGVLDCNGSGTGATVSSNTTFNYTGGTLKGSGKLTINGTINWSGSGEYQLSNTTISSTGVLNIIGTDDRKFRYGAGTISNDGTINWTGSGKIRGADKGFQNNSNGVFNIQVNAILEYDGAGGNKPTFVNNGTLNLGSYILSGSHNFTNSDGGCLLIGSTDGITSTGSTGNIQNSETRTFHSGGKYYYNGTSAQVTGSGLPATVSEFKIDNNAGVTLSASVTASSSLILTDGTLSTGSNTVTLGSSTASLGTLSRTNGKIVGNFKRWLAASTVNDVVFPIGTASNYRPANISFSSAPSSGGTITASFTSSDPGENGLPINDGGTSIVNAGTNGYWTLTAAEGLTGGTYNLDLTADGFSGVSDYTSLRLLKRVNSGGNWTVEGTHSASTGSNSTPVIHRTGLTSFSEFGVGSTDANPLPVALTSFTAASTASAGSATSSATVVLNWQTATEVNNYGFEILRRFTPQNDSHSEQSEESDWQKIGFVAGHGNSNSPKNYEFTDSELPNSDVVSYRLKQIDTDGNYEYSEIVEVELVEILKKYKLSQNYPNPFNPSTQISFSIPQNSHVKLELFNTLGEKVATLLDKEMSAGSHNYQLSISNYQLPSGIYFYKLQSGNYVETKKMILMK